MVFRVNTINTRLIQHRRLPYALAIVALAVIGSEFVGCARPAAQQPAPRQASAEGKSNARPQIAWRDRCLEVYRNNHQISPEDGCISTFVVEESIQKTMSLACGMSEQTVSHVTWKCLETNRQSCLFQFDYYPPEGGRRTPGHSKQVRFTGTPIVIFENHISRTTLRPASSAKLP